MLQKISGRNKNNTGSEVLEAYFTSRQLRFQKDEEHSFIVPVSEENGQWNIHLEVDEERSVLEIHSLCPVKIKDQQKLRIAELIARINCRILLGGFILVFEDCNLYLKTTHLFQGHPLDPENIEILLTTNIYTLNQYLPAIVAVNSGFTEPVLAIP